MLLLGLIELVLVGVVCLVLGFAAGFASAGVMRGAPAAARALAAAAGPPLPMRQDDVLRANVKDVRAGGLLGLKGFGDDFEDVDLEVEQFTRFARGPRQWHVLEGTYKNRPVGLEWHEEQGRLAVYAHKRLDGRSLADVGLTPQALDALQPGATHTHEGVAYRLRDAGPTLGHKDGTGFGKELRTWELFSADGLKVLRVSRRGEEPHKASLGEEYDPGALIEIYKVRA